jgi:hypothetical protein
VRLHVAVRRALDGEAERVQHVVGAAGVVEHAEPQRVTPPSRVDEIIPSPLTAMRATIALLTRASSRSSSTPGGRRRKQRTPSVGDDRSSSSSSLSTRAAASCARSRQRSMVARKASTPKYWSETQIFSARAERVSWIPRSPKLTSRSPVTSASRR